VKETVGAMELTEDYYTHTGTAVIHMLTHIRSSMCVSVECREDMHGAI